MVGRCLFKDARSPGGRCHFKEECLGKDPASKSHRGRTSLLVKEISDNATPMCYLASYLIQKYGYKEYMRLLQLSPAKRKRILDEAKLACYENRYERCRAAMKKKMEEGFEKEKKESKAGAEKQGGVLNGSNQESKVKAETVAAANKSRKNGSNEESKVEAKTVAAATKSRKNGSNEESNVEAEKQDAMKKAGVVRPSRYAKQVKDAIMFNNAWGKPFTSEHLGV